MPVYDYICSACRHRTEFIHGINEDGPRFCPACGAENTMRKGFTTPSIVFKGSGWAKKDRATSAHRSASARSAASNGGSASSADAGGSTSGDAGSSTSQPSAGSTERGSSAGSGSKSGSDGAGRDGGGAKGGERTEPGKPAPTRSKAAGGD